MLPHDSPWRTAEEAGKRIHRPKRFVQREIRAGRMRGAHIGRAYLTQDPWIDEWVEKHAAPIVLASRRRG
jgi:hypothetical protein